MNLVNVLIRIDLRELCRIGRKQVTKCSLTDLPLTSAAWSHYYANPPERRAQQPAARLHSVQCAKGLTERLEWGSLVWSESSFKKSFVLFLPAWLLAAVVLFQIVVSVDPLDAAREADGNPIYLSFHAPWQRRGKKCCDDNVLCTMMVIHLDDQCKS